MNHRHENTKIPAMPRHIDPGEVFNDHVAWVHKLIKEKNPPGLIMGLSGTDSILAFLVCARAFAEAGKADRVVGIHYADNKSFEDIEKARKLSSTYGWFANIIVPWLREQTPGSVVTVERNLSDYTDDYARWADLSRRALYKTTMTQKSSSRIPHDEGQNYWVVGTRNVTEEILGTYSYISTAVSVQPIIDLWKSEVLKICEHQGVPKIAMEMSRVPDCLCGRAETAAEHIEALDAVLMVGQGKLNPTYLARSYTSDLLEKLQDHIAQELRLNSFKGEGPNVPDTVSTLGYRARGHVI